MADISLLFDVEGGASLSGGSGKEISSQLAAIVSQINSEPFKIKFEAERESLQNIRAAVKEITKSLEEGTNIFKGFNFNLSLKSNPIQNNIKYANSAKQSIAQLKEQASQLESVFQSVYKRVDGINSVIASLSGTSSNLLNGRNILEITKNANDPSASLNKQMLALKEYIALMEESARYHGIDISQVAAGFGRSADEIVESTQSILSGEEAIAEQSEQLKSIFGSGINSEELKIHFGELNTSIGSVTTAIQSLSTDSKTGLSTLLESIESITAAIRELGGAISGLNVTQVTKVTGDAKSKNEDAAATKAQADAYKQATGIVTRYYQVMTKLATTKHDVVLGDDGKYASQSGVYSGLATAANNAAEAFSHLDAVMKALPAEKQAEVTKRMARAQEDLAIATDKAAAKQAEHDSKTVNATAVEKQYEGVIGRIQNALTNYTSAQYSKNEASRAAYQALDQEMSGLNELYGRVKRGEASYEELYAAVQKADAAFRGSVNIIKGAGDATKTLGDRVKGLASKFATWFSITRVIMAVYRTMRQMIQVSIELDDAFTQLRIVTGATDDEMRSFADTAFELSKNLGRSATEITKSIETFSRLGYSLPDASKLAEYATILANVANVSAEEATTGLTSIIKGFNLDVDKAEHVADILVSVGQRYAVSASEMIEAYEKSGAALHATNTSLEKSAGLIAAANASVQNAGTVGTALKTVSARIRGSKTDLEELGEGVEDLANGFSKYAEEIKALTGFNIMVEGTTDQFKDIYDIFEGIAAVWGKLSDTQQARVSEILGGTRQLQVISSIIGNWGDAAGAYTDAMNAAGEATKANNVYMESATAHINQFKAVFQELSSNLFSGGTISAFVQIGTTLLSIINALQKVHVLLPAVAGTIAAIKGFSIAKRLAGITTGLIAEKKVTDSLAVSVANLTMMERNRLRVNIQNAVATGQLTAQEGAQIISTLGLTAAEGGLAVANKTLATSFKSVMASIPIWGWVALGISVVLEAVNLLTSGLGKTTDRLQDVQEELNQLDSEIQQISNGYRELKQSADDVIPRFTQLAAGVDMFGKNVSLTSEEYSEFLSLNNKIAEMFPELNLGMDENGNAMLALSFSADTLRESLEALIEVQRQEANEAMAAKMPEKIDKTIELIGEYEKKIGEVEDQIQQINNGQFTRTLFGDADSVVADAKNIKEFYDLVDYLRDRGIDVSVESKTVGLTGSQYTATWDAASSQAENAVAGYLKEIDDIKARIESKWKSVNPSINAWLQSDYLYNDLNAQMQGIAQSMVSALNFNDLGLVGKNGKQTAENIQNYITQFVINPLYSASDDVKLAFGETLSMLESGEIDGDEFAKRMKGAFDKLLADMAPSEVDSFKQAFISAFSSLGTDFDTIVDGLIQTWGRLGKSGGGLELSDLSASAQELKSAYDILSKAQGEMASGGLSPETIKSLADATDNYLTYLYEENGVIKMNTEAWKKYADAQMKKDTTGIEQEITRLQEEREEIEANLQKWQEYDDGDTGGGHRLKAAKIKEYSDALDENTEAMERNQNLLGLYGTLYDNIAGSADAYSAALNNFTTVADTINSVSDSLTTLADIQEEVANGFTISLDKALEFASVYPQILDNASLAADGQITLNEDVVNSFIEGKEAELQGQIDAKIAELEADKDVLTAKRDFAQAELDLAQSVGEGEGQITQELAEYRVNAGNAVAQALIEAGIDEATAYQLAMAAMSQNSEEFNRIAAQVCTDVDGNFNKAAYNAAQAIYLNMKNASTSLDGIIRAAHNAAAAISGIGSGKQAGTTGAFGGAGGTTTGGANITLSNGTFNGVDYSYTPKTITLDQFISDLELDIASYTKAIAQIDGQIAALQALRGTSLDRFSSSSKGGKSGGSGGSGGSGSGSGGGGDDGSNWFEEQYRLHQHLLSMDQEEVEDYLEWLNDAYQRAYDENLIDLNDWYKYREEVYKKLQDLFKDYLNDVEHEIDMRSEFEGENKKIISLYKKLIADVEKEIAAARAAGLDDTDDYIQELQKKWSSYRDSIKEIEEDALEGAKDAIDELVDYRIDMLKKDIESERDALKKKLDNLKEFYDKQKEMLQDARDEEKYLDEQAEKRKSVSDIQAELAQLEYDDSAWAQKRKAQLRAELADAQKDLDDFEKDHALQETLDFLDNAYNAQEQQINAEMDALEKRLNDPEALYNQALADIRADTGKLYEEMVEFNRRYGTGNDEDIKDTWENAYKALWEFHDLTGEWYKGVVLPNSTRYTPSGESWDTANVSGTNPANQNGNGGGSSGSNGGSGGNGGSSGSNGSPKLDDDTKRKVAAAIWNGGYGWGNNPDRAKRLTEVFGENNGIQSLVNKGVGKNDKAPSKDYTYLNMRKKFRGYASGTGNAIAGLHAIDELGTETIFESADGTRYKMFTGGEKVLNAKASNFLYEFANKGADIIEKIVRGVLGGSVSGIGSPITSNEIKMGDIIIQGSADKATISEIRRAQRESVDMMLRELNRLNR